MLEDCLDLESELLLRERHQPRSLMDGPLLPRASIEPDFRLHFAAQLDERPVDRLFAHAMGAMRVGEVTGHEDEIRLHLLEEIADDRDVRGANRILPNLSSLIKWQ